MLCGLSKKIKTAFGWSDVKGAVLASGKATDRTTSTKGLQKAWSQHLTLSTGGKEMIRRVLSDYSGCTVWVSW